MSEESSSAIVEQEAVSVAGRPDSDRRNDVQGLRALAVLAVVAFHAGLPVPGGFVGVDMFFVISGFVITGTLLRELQRSEGISFVRFYSRRVRRLMPALAVVLVVVTIASFALLSPLGSQQQAAKTGGATSFFAANAQLFRTPAGYFDAPAETNPLLHTWSLAVEEQFYLIYPALLLVAWRLGRRVARKVPPQVVGGVVLVVGAAVSFALSIRMTRSGGTLARFAFYSSPTRAWEFAAGCLVALAAPALALLPRLAALALGGAGMAGLVASVSLIHATTPFPGTAALLPVVGAALLIVSGTISARGIAGCLSVRPLTWIGDVSYGWYLWHWPLIVMSRVLWPDVGWVPLAAAALALVPTWLSYRFVEQPVRLNSGLVGRRVLPVVSMCITGPLACSLALYGSARVFASRGSARQVKDQAEPHADTVRGCASTLPLPARMGFNCTWRAQPSRGSVVLIGDSNAGQFAEPLAAAANRLGLDLTDATFGGCPFVDLTIAVTTPFDDASCRRFVAESVSAIREEHPSLVVVASASSKYINSSSVAFQDRATEHFVRTPEAKAVLWERGLTAVLDQLSGVGIPVVVVHAVPQFRDFDLQLCPAYRLYSGTCGRSSSRADIEAQQRLARQAEKAAIAGSQGTIGVDFTDQLCSRSRCSTEWGAEWLYRDGEHLSVGGSLLLTDRFGEIIRART